MYSKFNGFARKSKPILPFFGISHSLSDFPSRYKTHIAHLSHRLARCCALLRISYILRRKRPILATYCGLLFGQILCSAFKSSNFLRFCRMLRKEKAGALKSRLFGESLAPPSIVGFPALQVVYRGPPIGNNEDTRRALANEISAANVLAVAAQCRSADFSFAIFSPFLESIHFHNSAPPLFLLYRLCTGNQAPPVPRRDTHLFFGYALLKLRRALSMLSLFVSAPRAMRCACSSHVSPRRLRIPSSRIFSSLPAPSQSPSTSRQAKHTLSGVPTSASNSFPHPAHLRIVSTFSPPFGCWICTRLRFCQPVSPGRSVTSLFLFSFSLLLRPCAVPIPPWPTIRFAACLRDGGNQHITRGTGKGTLFFSDIALSPAARRQGIRDA